MEQVQFEDDRMVDPVMVIRRRQSMGMITRFLIDHRLFARAETVQYLMLAITGMCFILSIFIVLSVL